MVLSYLTIHTGHIRGCRLSGRLPSLDLQEGVLACLGCMPYPPHKAPAAILQWNTPPSPARPTRAPSLSESPTSPTSTSSSLRTRRLFPENSVSRTNSESHTIRPLTFRDSGNYRFTIGPQAAGAAEIKMADHHVALSQDGEPDVGSGPPSDDGASEGSEDGEIRDEYSDEGEDGEGDVNTYEDDEYDEEAFADGITVTALEQKLKEIEAMLYQEKYVNSLGNDKAVQNQFLADYERYISIPPPPEQDNVLHFMASRGLPCPWLIKHILKHHKKRMDDVDDARRRPLTRAIELKKELFIETVLESNYDDADLERILGINTSDMGNGIHTAIIRGLSSSLIIKLIQNVSNDVLSQQDGAGCTPLHRAVEYQRCTVDQINVVKALLDRGDSALDVSTKKKLTVYQHHFASRPKTDPKDKPAPLTTRSETRGDSTTRKPPSSHLGPGSADKPSAQKIDKRELDKKKEVPDKKNINATAPSRTQAQEDSPAMLQAADPPWGRLKRTMTDRLVRGDDQNGNSTPASPTVYQSNEGRKALPVSQPQDPATTTTSASKAKTSTTSRNGPTSKTGRLAATRKISAKEAPQVKKSYADKIAHEVKLRYLRSTFITEHRSHDTAVDFLYGENQGVFCVGC